ncbi:protein ALP1-like [Teleopsis dalmanni]|uniref:protein ALP1-like n=1 Tax=Teleopsis dalmanni TaxID=139649 RepID=UPI0018CD5F2F|nr:protein ALP1-like [Teleopsis dalmanni]XP_037950512.1 protein ALP1-like [Teleopsis dalmanni]
MENEIAVAALQVINTCLTGAISALQEENKRRRKRKAGAIYCIKPRYRSECTNIQTLITEYNLASDMSSLESYLLMDENIFNELYSYVENNIQKQDTHLRKSIPGKALLAASIRFLVTGENFRELGEKLTLSQSYLKENFLSVCNAIYMKMKGRYLKFPNSKEKWIEVANDFEDMCQFPNCLGALEAKHIAFTPSKEKSSLFCNNKGYTSIVLLALADANAKFLFIDVGYKGCISDEDVFFRSILSDIVENSDTIFPPPRLVGNNRKLPFVILGRNGFPLLKNLMVPYPKSNTDPKSVNFNTRLNRGHQSIGRALGILSNRFRVFQRPILLNETKAKAIVLCCCVLHNFLIEKSSWYKNLYPNDMEEEDFSAEFIENLENAAFIRDKFANHFQNEGKS